MEGKDEGSISGIKHYRWTYLCLYLVALLANCLSNGIKRGNPAGLLSERKGIIKREKKNVLFIGDKCALYTSFG